jgi:hypothetical protein
MPQKFLNPVNLTDDEDTALTFTDEGACQVAANMLNRFAVGTGPFDGPFQVAVIRAGRAFLIEDISKGDLFVARD